ncbi:MAG: hypothetical protein ABI162_07070 [Luteolibacter sp.]
MNDTTPPLDPVNNSRVIHMIVFTVCASALVGVLTEAACIIFKIPDMNNTLSGAFMHVVDTLIGAMIAMLIQTRPQAQVSPPPALDASGATPVTISNQPSNPVPVHDAS